MSLKEATHLSHSHSLSARLKRRVSLSSPGCINHDGGVRGGLDPHLLAAGSVGVDEVIAPADGLVDVEVSLTLDVRRDVVVPEARTLHDGQQPEREVLDDAPLWQVPNGKKSRNVPRVFIYILTTSKVRDIEVHGQLLTGQEDVHVDLHLLTDRVVDTANLLRRLDETLAAHEVLDLGSLQLFSLLEHLEDVWRVHQVLD